MRSSLGRQLGKLSGKLSGAARASVSAEEFSTEATKAFSEEDPATGEELAKAMCSAYERHGQALREAMQSIGWEYPKVIGVSWSILSVVESNDDDVEIEEPLAEITITTLATGETPPSVGKFSFLCNKNQLLDIQWRVREAENFLRTVASSSSSTDATVKPKRILRSPTR